jgi:hypothetical protein
MAFTVVLIPMSILLGVLVLMAVGLTGILYGDVLGQWARSKGLGDLSRPTAGGLGSVAFSILTGGLQLIPYVGAALQLLLVAIGIGALILTRLGTRQFRIQNQGQIL